MGTNYYFHPSEDDKELGFVESIHIGKSSVGWSFIFHGYEQDDLARSIGDSDGILYRKKAPNLSIRSKKDWFEIFSNHTGTIKNEYGKTLTIEEFLQLVDEFSPSSEYNGRKVSKLPVSSIRIHDSEGYSIAFYNFS